MNKFLIPLSFCTLLFAQNLYANEATNNVRLKPSDMNHLFYTPTTRINDKDEITASFHEVAYGLGNKVHVQFSLFDNVGRVNFGMKYGFSDSFVLGAGLAQTFATLPNGHHGIHANGDERLGLYLTKQINSNQSADVYFTGHTQIASVASFGLDLGINLKQADNYNIILEAGSSYDTNSQDLYLNADGGVRIFLSEIEKSYIDAGIDLADFNATNEYADSPRVKIYLDFGAHF